MVVGGCATRAARAAPEGAALAATGARLVLGGVVDRMDARVAGCIVVGLGVGNTVSLPGLLVGREFSRAQFASVVSLITATNQETPRAATAPRWRSVSGSTRWRPAWS